MIALAISNKVIFKVAGKIVKRELVRGKFVYREIFGDGSSRRMTKRELDEITGNVRP